MRVAALKQFFVCRSDLSAFLVVTGIVLLLFGDVLFSSDRVLSSGNTDVFLTFYHQRHFAATEMRAGNFPHWNPYIYSGSTFSLDSEPALCYPLNFHYLLLPTHQAINVDIFLHFILLGFFFYLWVSRQGIPFLASLTGSVAVMFSGAYYMHFFAGHLGVLATSAWVPLVMYVIDRFVAEPARWLRWGLVGSFAVAMSLLAGQMQYAIIGACAAGAYALLLTILGWRTVRFLPLFFFVGIYAAALFLAAVAVVPAYDGMITSYRAAVSETFLASFSFHPENLITVVAPSFFGGSEGMMYWGKEYHWEECFFIGAGALSLVGLALRGRLQKGAFIAVLLFLVLALGAHTPLFEVTKHLPIFDKMRGQGKFIFASSLFIAFLVSHGAAEMIHRYPHRMVPFLVAGAALFWGVAAYVLGNALSLEEWRTLMMRVALADPRFVFYGNPQLFDDPVFILRSQSTSAVALYQVAGKFLALAVLFAISRRWRVGVYLVLFVIVAELFLFAREFRSDFSASRFKARELEDLKNTLAPYERTADFTIANRAMTAHVPTTTGYNSRILSERYHRLLPFLERREMWLAENTETFSHRYGLASLLRIRSIIIPSSNGPQAFVVSNPPFPRAFLVDRYLVKPQEETVEATLSLGKDLISSVVLEREPSIFPVPGAVGKVTVTDISTDERLIEVTVDTPRLLVLTDAYDPRWEAFPEEGSTQGAYEILPADGVLFAIPLEAGHHRILLRYLPFSWRIGAAISIAAWAVFGVIGVIVVRRRGDYA